MTPSTYTLGNEQECERLEAQALLGGFDDMHRHLSLAKSARVLDAGSGSGAYARAIARNDPTANVIGVDINPSYVAYSTARATQEGLTNLTFQIGDLRAMPFKDATFDVIWTRYVLYFLPEPERALAEFRRGLRPGGRVVIALNDLPSVIFDPPEPDFQADVQQALKALGDTGLTVRLPGMLRRLGFVDIQADLSADPVYSAIGGHSPGQQANLSHNLASGRPYFVQTFNSEARADEIITRWLAYLQRPDALMMVPFWHISGIAPLA